MIRKYIIRDNIDNGHIYGEPTGLLAVPFDRAQAGFDTLEKAKEKFERIIQKYPYLRDKLYITETEYADEKRQQQDFHIQSYIRWAGWLCE